jgi:electron transport complex protein RnfC
VEGGAETTAPVAEADAAAAAKKATILAAMERAKAQREAAAARNTEQLTGEQQHQLDTIAARRNAAGLDQPTEE